MPHQDKEDLRTPLDQLKEVLGPVTSADLKGVKRHGNSVIDGPAIAMLALLTFGWGRFKTLGERFAVARDATTRLLPYDKIAASHQALMVTLRSCSETLIQSIHSQLVTQLKVSSKWLFLRRPTFAVDGSQFAVPRTKQNLAHFAAASRKSKAAYKKQSDYAKAKSTQIAVSLCMHLTTCLPFLWNTGGSADSERGLLLGMLDRLPAGSRLVMDAYYFGFEFWNRLIEQGFTFVVRAGRNIELLDQLRAGGKIKCRGNLVLYWPQCVIDIGGKPIVLNMVEVMV